MLSTVALRRRTLFGIALCALALGMFGGPFSQAGAETADDVAVRAKVRVAVVYPDIGEPYRSVFVSIIRGVSEELGIRPITLPLRNDAGEEVRARLQAAQPDVCIALGRTALELVDSLALEIPVIRGAVLDPRVDSRGTGTPRGVSLSPDPALLLAQLKNLAPRVTRVSVVYSSPEGQPLIDRAVEAGRALRLQVLVHKAEDLAGAAAIYKSLVPTLGSEDALWIPQDPKAVDDKVILPMLLNAAWEQNFALFSSNGDHAKRGVLFSVYPDNVGMGRRLAQIALRHAAGTSAGGGMEPLSDLLVGVNLRAAEHLRLNLSPELIRSFDLTFPQR